MKISIKLLYQYMAIFFNFSPTSNHLQPLQVENCDRNSRLVVDEGDYVKLRLERVNPSPARGVYIEFNPLPASNVYIQANDVLPMLFEHFSRWIVCFYFSSFEAGIADAISSFKWRKICVYVYVWS